LAIPILILAATAAHAQPTKARGDSSYMPVDIQEPFASIVSRLKSEKSAVMKRHVPPYYTDNSMHNLQTERFYKPKLVNGMMMSADGPIKTFPLRGIKESPPYLHDGRLLTLEDTVEFFNLVLETHLEAEEKKDLVAFMRAL
jgi:hypothetical protein